MATSVSIFRWKNSEIWELIFACIARGDGTGGKVGQESVAHFAPLTVIF